MKHLNGFVVPNWLRTCAFVALLGTALAPTAHAAIVLDLSSVGTANVNFAGTGTGAKIAFNNNSPAAPYYSGYGFAIGSSTGVGDSVFLPGKIGGMFSYATSSIVTSGNDQTASLIIMNGTFSITDASQKTFTATLTGGQIDTSSPTATSSSGAIYGALELSNVTYTGSNADLLALQTGIAADGGNIVISFQFIAAEPLSELAAAGSNEKTTYSATVSAGSFSPESVPEPASLTLGFLSLGTVLMGACRRKAAPSGAVS
jgi:hypothetical protein